MRSILFGERPNKSQFSTSIDALEQRKSKKKLKVSLLIIPRLYLRCTATQTTAFQGGGFFQKNGQLLMIEELNIFVTLMQIILHNVNIRLIQWYFLLLKLIRCTATYTLKLIWS